MSHSPTGFVVDSITCPSRAAASRSLRLFRLLFFFFLCFFLFFFILVCFGSIDVKSGELNDRDIPGGGSLYVDKVTLRSDCVVALDVVDSVLDSVLTL